MKDLTVHFLIPARDRLRRGEALNLLVGVRNAGVSAVDKEFSFTAQTDSGVLPLLREKRTIPPGETLHAYFTVPSSALEAVEDSEFVLTLEDPPFPGKLIEYL